MTALAALGGEIRLGVDLHLGAMRVALQGLRAIGAVREGYSGMLSDAGWDAAAVAKAIQSRKVMGRAALA